MHGSDPTIGFMSPDQRNPTGYTMRLTRPPPARPTSSPTPPTLRCSAPLTAATSVSSVFGRRRTVLRRVVTLDFLAVFPADFLAVFLAGFLAVFLAVFFFAMCPHVANRNGCC